MVIRHRKFPVVIECRDTWDNISNLIIKDLLENSEEGKFLVKSHGVGKYGRVLGELYVKGHVKSVNDLLKEHGHAYAYFGGKKKLYVDGVTKWKIL